MEIELRTSNNRLNIRYTFDKKNRSVYFQFGNTLGSKVIWGGKRKIVYNTNADIGSLKQAIDIYCEREGIEKTDRWTDGYSFGKALTDMLFA